MLPLSGPAIEYTKRVPVGGELEGTEKGFLRHVMQRTVAPEGRGKGKLRKASQGEKTLGEQKVGQWRWVQHHAAPRSGQIGEQKVNQWNGVQHHAGGCSAMLLARKREVLYNKGKFPKKAEVK